MKIIFLSAVLAALLLTNSVADNGSLVEKTVLCRYQLSRMHQSNDPLHGKTLEMIVTALVDHFGWKELGQIIRINCFNSNPSIKSSLTFLRKTPWARKKVEDLYISILK